MSLPPRPPNDDQLQGKQSAPTTVAVHDVLDDTTLMTVVTALYAFFHWVSHYGVQDCTC